MSRYISILTAIQAIFLPSNIFAAVPVIYEQDFSSDVLPQNRNQAYYGFFNNFVTPGEISVSANSAIINDELVIQSNSGFRGIGITLDSSDLNGPGTYDFQFDLIDFQLNSVFGNSFNDFLEVSVWTGNGFETNSQNALLVNAQIGDLQALGSATSTEIANQTYSFQDVPNTGTFNFNFDYDGSDALVIYLGAVTDGFPFPQITIDNIQLTGVPEPQTIIYLSISSALVFIRRRRAS